MISYRFAEVADIPAISALQEKYHVSTILPEDKADGFVTTAFTEAQFKKLIEQENGVALACDGKKIIGYAMSGSWAYWSEWPLFAYMIKNLSNVSYLGMTATTENSFQYGPVCIDKEYRGQGVVANIFEFSRREFSKRYRIMLTFINKINPRSLAAHTKKAGFDIITTFEFNNNQYYELGYDMEKPVANSTL